MHTDITQWNRRHVLLHPRTSNSILKTVRRLVPEYLNVVDTWTSSEPLDYSKTARRLPSVSDKTTEPASGSHLTVVRESMTEEPCQDFQPDDDDGFLIVDVYKYIESCNCLGATEGDLKVCRMSTDSSVHFFICVVSRCCV